jgi:hypothetical protein
MLLGGGDGDIIFGLYFLLLYSTGVEGDGSDYCCIEGILGE